MAKAPAETRTVAELRAARGDINNRIETLKQQARSLSEKIREKEGPIPDRGARKTGFAVRPAQ